MISSGYRATVDDFAELLIHLESGIKALAALQTMPENSVDVLFILRLDFALVKVCAAAEVTHAIIHKRFYRSKAMKGKKKKEGERAQKIAEAFCSIEKRSGKSDRNITDLINQKLKENFSRTTIIKTLKEAGLR